MEGGRGGRGGGGERFDDRLPRNSMTGPGIEPGTSDNQTRYRFHGLAMAVCKAIIVRAITNLLLRISCYLIKSSVVHYQ